MIIGTLKNWTVPKLVEPAKCRDGNSYRVDKILEVRCVGGWLVYLKRTAWRNATLERDRGFRISLLLVPISR
jgi:hypothetical protein